MRKLRPVTCNDYNSQTVSRRNWILSSLVSDFQQRIRKKRKKKKKSENKISSIRPVACKACNS